MNCTGITSVIFPNSLESIGFQSFKGCSKIESITFGNGLKTIGSNAFDDCIEFKKVIIPDIASWCEIDHSYNPISIAHHIYYNETEEITELHIPDGVKTIGKFAFEYCYGLKSVYLPNSVDSIGEGAFLNCNIVESISIGNGIKKIGDDAFLRCDKLSKVIIPDISSFCLLSFKEPSHNPLYYAKKLYIDENTEVKKLIIPEGVSSIGNRVFYDCQNINHVSFPKSLKSIGDYAFEHCSALSTLEFEKGDIRIGQTPFTRTPTYKSIVISDIASFCNVSTLYQTASTNRLFTKDGNEIIDLEIPVGVDSVAENAFRNFENLESVRIPNGLKNIGENAFSGCRKLKKVIVPDISSWCKVDINGKVFFDVYSLYTYEGAEITEIKAFDDIKTIKDYAFYYCNSIKSIDLPISVTSIGKKSFYDCRGLTSITLPNSVTNIGDAAFSYCNGLTSITIPNSVTVIEEDAFNSCGGLTSITIPNSVTTIGNNAFRNCNGLTSITIPKSVTSIGYYAFTGYLFTSIKVENVEPIAITALAVPNFRNITLYVPKGSKAAYEAADYWKEFKEIVEYENDILTLTANSYSRAYGEANPTFGYTVTEGTITSGTPTISCDATATSPVGTYDIVIAKGTISNNTVSLVKGTLTITKAPLTVSAGNYTKVEGEDNPVFAPTYSGFKNGETAAVLTKQPVITTTATKTSTAGTYPVTVSGAEAQNYSFNYQNGTLTVTSQSVVQKDNIQFADAKVKAICVANWDTDHDGELSKQEAAAVTSIGEVFSWKSEITSFDELQYFTGLTAIDDNAFAGCDGLTSITLPNTVTSLGAYAFSGCDGLTSFVIPSSVTTLNDAVFNYCVGLTSIIIPKSVTRMGFNPLNGCSALTSIQVESGNPNFDSRNGCNAIIYGKSGILVSGCKNTVIPDGIKTIWQYAFGGCEELTSITIPASVTTFGDYAFFGCDNLEEIHSEIVQPSAINATVFGNTDIFTTATLYVPAGTKAQYQATDGWKDFRNIVEQGGTATDIASATITIENTSYPYTGSAIEPAVSVVYSGTTLVKGTDYSLSYKNNIMAGTATVTATGVGNYTGTVTATFTIDKAQLVVTAQSIMREYGEENPGFTCKISGFMNEDTVLDLTKLPVITTTASTMSPVGTYDITVSGGEARNYSFSYEAGTLTIVPKGIATATLTVADSCAYTGQPIWPDVTVQLDGRVLTEGTDYSLTFTNNFMPGIASLTIMGVGNYTGTVTKTFVIFTPTAIGDVDADATKFDVYDMSGRKIRRHVTNIEGLPKGVYIIGGRKRAVK